MKARKSAVRTKKASHIVLSGCIAASMVSSAAALHLQEPDLKAQASGRIQLPEIQEVSQTPAALQIPEALTVLQAAAPPEAAVPETLQLFTEPGIQAQAETISVEYRICDDTGKNWETRSEDCTSIRDAVTGTSDSEQEFTKCQFCRIFALFCFCSGNGIFLVLE